MADAEFARSLGACCLKTLASIAEHDPDPAISNYAWRELQRALLVLRSFAADPANPAEARAEAEATLRGFLDS
jgi:hypothetical protein